MAAREKKSKRLEMEEWAGVNRKLRQHGLPSISTIHQSEVTSTSDVVVLESDVAKSLRQSVVSLMTDCDRRQELIQELISTNNQLKEDLSRQQNLTEKYETRIKDLKIMLEDSRAKISELQDDNYTTSNYLHDEETKLRNTKNAISAKYRELQNRCKQQDDEIYRLKKKIDRMTQEDEKRMLHQSEVYKEIRKKSSRGQQAMDEKLLDIIDSYERQIHGLKKELDILRFNGEDERPRHDTSFDEPSENYKTLIKTYEKQLKESKKKIKSFEDQVEILNLELGSRPELKDFRSAQHRIKKLEKILAKHNIRLSDEKNQEQGTLKYSTQVDDIDYLPLNHCRKYLSMFCTDVGVFDLDHVQPKLQKQAKAVEAYPRLEQFAREVLEVVDSSNVPMPPGVKAKSHRSSHKHEVWCEKMWHHVIPTLQYWVQQLAGLKELQHSINKLSSSLLPWKTSKFHSNPTVTQMVSSIDSLLYEEESKSREIPSQTVLQGIVEHFQNLFDVPKVSGIYPRMNDIYTRLGEMQNVIKTLRNLLGLHEEARTTAIVDAVGRLCQNHNATTTQQLKQLLQVDELDGVIKKLEEHESFFPVFQDIISKLMEILDVHKMDQVIPAVRAVKLLAT
ncbi:unnamed protein product [Owenia fusiformis]|uniref:Centrosomal protein of 70 kDa n=1 Tax=Owenia fusiformis TaxID=6347 RepID=A0A8S4MV83_OWEFU|nr:unnamed protein product [Owenia fusiformis]